MKRIPIVATLVVAVAIATMIVLGMWQLRRMHWKDALVERYAAASQQGQPVPFPLTPAAREADLYRKSAFVCARVLDRAAIAGRSAHGEAGWAQTARCSLTGGGEAQVVLGWASQPATVAWNGGPVTGTIGPAANGEVRLIANPPLAGLGAHAAPDPRDVPNNHLSYAAQWFLFAASAAAIYGIAVWKRLAGSGSRG